MLKQSLPYEGTRLQQNSTKRPVLLLGFIPRIITIIARSLNTHGVPVDVASCSSKVRSPSSTIRRSFLLSNPCIDANECVAKLRALIVENGYDMLIPTDDQGLVLLATYHAELNDLIHVACPPATVLQLVLNKVSTIQIARRCGLRVPDSVVVGSSQALEDALLHMRLPAVVKPAVKGLRGETFKSCVVRSIEEIPRQLTEAQNFDPPLLVQEFCDGVGVGVEILMHQGEPRAVFQHRRLKEYPVSGGFSVVATAEAPHTSLVNASISLLREMHWEGVAMVEYRVDPCSGEAVLLEVNGRYWGSIGLPVAAGMDFPLYQWQLVHGEVPNVPQTYQAGTMWRWTAGYVARLHELTASAIKSSEGRDALKRALRDLPSDFSPAVRDASFRWSDPIPGIGELSLAADHFIMYDAKAVLRRILKKHLPRRYSLSHAE